MNLRKRTVLRTVVFVFCLWQLEVCLIFRTVRWQTDIMFIKLPNWFVVTFYSMIALAVFLWSESEKRAGLRLYCCCSDDDVE